MVLFWLLVIGLSPLFIRYLLAPKVKPLHHYPEYYGYSGGWANVMVCQCGSTSLYQDNHPVNPCRDCGTKKRRVETSGKWVGTHWEIKNDN